MIPRGSGPTRRPRSQTSRGPQGLPTASGHRSPSRHPQARKPLPIAVKTPAQQHVAKAIVRVGVKRNAPIKHIKAALETGAVESRYRNLHRGDSDSQGWRQERASLYRNPTNLKASINRFYDEASLLDRGQPAGRLAADVQRPAAPYRSRYGQKSKTADEILRAYLAEVARGAKRYNRKAA